jgi:hypothetical protein
VKRFRIMGLPVLLFVLMVLFWAQPRAADAPQSPLERCMAFLNVMRLSGVDVHQMTGEDTTLGRARWCEANGYPSTSDRKTAPEPKARTPQ